MARASFARLVIDVVIIVLIVASSFPLHRIQSNQDFLEKHTKKFLACPRRSILHFGLNSWVFLFLKFLKYIYSMENCQ